MGRTALLVALAALAGLGVALMLFRDDPEPVTTTVTRAVTVTRTVRADRYRPVGSFPVSVAERWAPSQVDLRAFVPADAGVDSSEWVPAAGGVPGQLVVTWTRHGRDLVDHVDHGLAVWERVPNGPQWATWKPVYRLRGAPSGYRSLRAVVGDVNGDRHGDVLLFDGPFGTGQCGVFRLLALRRGGARTLLRRGGCLDNLHLGLGERGLVVYEGRDRDPAIQSPHCCWRSWRREIRRWDGARPLAPRVSRVAKPPTFDVFG